MGIELKELLEKQHSIFVESMKGKEVKKGVKDITAVFHPTNTSYYPGTFGMMAWKIAVKENNDKFNKTAKRVADLPNGGMIVFSSDVQEANSGIESEMAALITEYQREFAHSYLQETLESYTDEKEMEGLGYTFGKDFQGRYISRESNAVFDENSFTVDIAGVDSKTLEDIASDIAHNFSQQTVLVRDFNSGSTYLVDGSRDVEPVEETEEVVE